MSWVSHWSATRFDADPGHTELDAVVPNPHVDRLAHLGIAGLGGEYELTVVVQTACQVDSHWIPPCLNSTVKSQYLGLSPPVLHHAYFLT
jgi:hypothetical protein